MKNIYDSKINDFIVEPKKVGIANLMWHITDRCNLSCPHCFSKSKTGTFDIENLSSYIDKFKRLGVQKIDLSGGEPLLHPQLPIICAELKKANIYFTITTSAFVDDSKLEWLVANASLFTRIILSINGPNKLIHEGINNGNGSFDKICSLAKKLSRICNNVRINTVCTLDICTKGIAQEFISLINDLSPNEWCIIQKYVEKTDYSDSSYNVFLDLINDYNPNGVSIITRESDRYSNYYVLEANGILFSRKDSKKKVSFDNIEEIELFIRKGE